MGCIGDKQLVPEEPRYNVIAKMSSDASRVQDGDEMKNMLKDMAALISKQNKEIQKLKEMRQTPKTNQANLSREQLQKMENIGSKSISKAGVICKECFSKLTRFTQIRPGITLCQNCRGSGVVPEQKPLSQDCQKCGDYRSVWKIYPCSTCYGRGAAIQ